MISSLVIILLNDNTSSHVDMATLQRFTELQYKIFLPPSDSPDLSPVDNQVCKPVDTFYA